MDMDSAVNEEQLQVEQTDDSCRLEFSEIVPFATDADGSCSTECVSGDWSAERFLQETLAVVKQELDCVSYDYNIHRVWKNLALYFDYFCM